MKKVLKVGIGVPNEGLTKPEAYDNHIKWAIHLGILQETSKTDDFPYQIEIYWATVGRLLTAFAREKMAEWALSAELDYIVMLDDDMIIYDADILEKLILRDVDIVAPLAFMRSAPHYPVMFKAITGFDEVTRNEYHINQVVKNYPKDTLVECDGVGFGMVAIKTSVLRWMAAPYFMSTVGTGEDILFCVKAKKAGFKVFMDTSLKLGHLGNPKVITEETYESSEEATKYREVYGTYSHESYMGEEKLNNRYETE